MKRPLFITATLITILFAWYDLVLTKPNTEPPEQQETSADFLIKDKLHSQVTEIPPKKITKFSKSIQTVTSSSKNAIKTCTESTQSHLDNLDVNAAFESLSQSPDPQDILTFLIFNNSIEPREKLEQLYQYHKNSPTESIAYYQLLNGCHLIDDQERCNGELFDSADQVDASNGMLNINIAALLIKRGEYSSALQEIRTAAAKDYFSEYYYRSLELFSNSMTTYSPDAFLESIITAMGYSAAQPAYYGAVFEYCMNANEADIDVMDACFQLGKTMSLNSHTIMLQGLGNALVTEFYLKNTYNDAALESENELSLITAQNFNRDTFNVMNLIFNDEDLVRLWLQIGKEQGEGQATKQLIQEAKWRSQDPNYNPCPPQVVQ